MAITSSPAVKVLLAAVFVLSSQPARGTPYEAFPSSCGDSSLTLDSTVGSTLHKKFIDKPDLLCLAIPNSGVKTIEDGAFVGVPSLIYLDLSGNQIPADQLVSFDEQKYLKWLNVNDQRSYSQGTTVQVKTRYLHLVKLNLRNTGITGVSSTVEAPFPALQYLDLAWNEFTVFAPGSNTFFNNVIQLDFGHNRLTNPNLTKLKKLVSLKLNDNKIASIGYSNGLQLGGLKQLEYLDLSNNQIDSINENAFEDLKKLTVLNLMRNSLRRFDGGSFLPLTSLRILNLDHNQLTTVPINLPPGLGELSMNCNSVWELTIQSFFNLTKLTKLSLGGNMISSITRVMFVKQELLEELHLNDNRLNYLPSHWDAHMGVLRHLNLARNQFTSLQAVFYSRDRPLEVAYLDDNPIETVHGNVFTLIPENATVYLNIGAERVQDFCAV